MDDLRCYFGISCFFDKRLNSVAGGCLKRGFRKRLKWDLLKSDFGDV